MNDIINIICTEKINISRLKYTINFINNHPLKPRNISFQLNNSSDNLKEILYTLNGNSGQHIPAQNIFFSLEKKDHKITLNKYKFEEELLYSVEEEENEVIDFEIGGFYHFDIFETIFYHISRYEEVYCTQEKLDIHKRMKSKEQLLVKHELHHTPIVDKIIFAFFKSLGLVNKTETTYSLSHDIDIIRKYNSIFNSLKSIGKVIQMGLGLQGIKNVFRSIRKSMVDPTFDPYYTFEWLFVSNSKFINKTVYFVTGGKTRYDLYNQNYLKELPSIISKAIQKSYEIGYHPSYNAYNNEEIFEQELNMLSSLNKVNSKHIRTHYLRLDIQSTFEIIEKYGFKTDSTLGFADDIGFRCGTGFEYYPYNFKEERAWKFKEIPLVFMDSSLIYSVCNNDVSCFKEKAKLFFAKNSFNTHIMINIHNSSFDNSLTFRKGLKEFYLDFISTL